MPAEDKSTLQKRCSNAVVRYSGGARSIQKAEADKRYHEEHRDTIEAEKLVRQKEAAKRKADTAAQACAQFSKKSSCGQGLVQASHQPTKLPLDVWGSILEKLCPTSLSALEGPSTIARHIINAQLICHESHAASGAAWGALAALIQADHHAQCSDEEEMSSMPNSQKSKAQKPISAALRNMPWEEYVANPLRSLVYTLHAHVPWDQVVSNPLSLKNEVLKEACRCVGQQVSGTKAILVLRLLQYFGTDRPCAVTAIVLLAVKHEKACHLSAQLNQSLDLVLTVRSVFRHFDSDTLDYNKITMFALRKVLASRFDSVTHLLQFASTLPGPQAPRSAHTGSKKRKKGRCGCGNQPAPTCQQACCKHCCRGPCARHNC